MKCIYDLIIDILVRNFVKLVGCEGVVFQNYILIVIVFIGFIDDNDVVRSIKVYGIVFNCDA